MLSFAERIREPRIIADAAREGGEERKQGAEEDGGDHLESPYEGRPGVFRIHNLASVALFGDDLLRENLVSQYPRPPWIQSHRFHQTHGCPFVPTGALRTNFSIITTIV